MHEDIIALTICKVLSSVSSSFRYSNVKNQVPALEKQALEKQRAEKQKGLSPLDAP